VNGHVGAALSSLPPLRWGVKLGWRACCGLASVHRLPSPRVTTQSLPLIQHDASQAVDVFDSRVWSEPAAVCAGAANEPTLSDAQLDELRANRVVSPPCIVPV
jgi:hypothetical protein